MSDKHKSTHPVEISYTNGESPTGPKLDAAEAQNHNAFDEVERSLGDVRGVNKPYTDGSATALVPPVHGTASTNQLSPADTTYNRDFDIANLARVIGPASNLNPQNSYDASVANPEITVTLASGVREVLLGTSVNSISSTTDTALVTDVSPAMPAAAGEYLLDSTKGTIYTYSATSGGTLTFEVNGNKYNPAQHSFNVIPDPRQINDGGNDCTVTGPDGNGKYTVTLPNITHLPYSVSTDATGALNVGDLSNARQATLPIALTSALTAGDTIPTGYVLLKDNTSNVVYDQGVYEYVDDHSFLVTGVTLTTSNTFSTLTVGSDITGSIADLRIRMGAHKHDGTFGATPIEAEHIVGWLETDGPSGGYYKTSYPSDYAQSYAHRHGFDSTYAIEDAADSDRYIEGQFFKGDLAIGAWNDYFYKSGQTDLDRTSTLPASHSIYWGSPEYSMYLQYDLGDTVYYSVLTPGVELQKGVVEEIVTNTDGYNTSTLTGQLYTGIKEHTGLIKFETSGLTTSGNTATIAVAGGVGTAITNLEDTFLANFDGQPDKALTAGTYFIVGCDIVLHYYDIGGQAGVVPVGGVSPEIENHSFFECDTSPTYDFTIVPVVIAGAAGIASGTEFIAAYTIRYIQNL